MSTSIHQQDTTLAKSNFLSSTISGIKNGAKEQFNLFFDNVVTVTENLTHIPKKRLLQMILGGSLSWYTVFGSTDAFAQDMQHPIEQLLLAEQQGVEEYSLLPLVVAHDESGEKVKELQARYDVVNTNLKEILSQWNGEKAMLNKLFDDANKRGKFNPALEDARKDLLASLKEINDFIDKRNAFHQKNILFNIELQRFEFRIVFDNLEERAIKSIAMKKRIDELKSILTNKKTKKKQYTAAFIEYDSLNLEYSKLGTIADGVEDLERRSNLITSEIERFESQLVIFEREITLLQEKFKQ